ncbi:MAG TPA: hypothetical protein DHW42_08700 [Candidatus Marinimicrobia bacterium]|nr:hypothetical protein [Candidatus Neomarinimicrobiota bacterium]
MINIYFYILLASALFTIGVIGLFLQKTRLHILLSTQLILSSAIIIGLLFSQKSGPKAEINLFIIVILLGAFFMFLISSIYEYKNNQSLSDREL